MQRRKKNVLKNQERTGSALTDVLERKDVVKKGKIKDQKQFEKETTTPTTNKTTPARKTRPTTTYRRYKAIIQIV